MHAILRVSPAPVGSLKYMSGQPKETYMARSSRRSAVLKDDDNSGATRTTCHVGFLRLAGHIFQGAHRCGRYTQYSMHARGFPAPDSALVLDAAATARGAKSVLSRPSNRRRRTGLVSRKRKTSLCPAARAGHRKDWQV